MQKRRNISKVCDTKPASRGEAPCSRTFEKDQQLCDLELRETAAQSQFQILGQRQGELEDSRNRYAALYDLVPTGFVVFDEKASIRESNQTASDMVGVSSGQMTGVSFTRFVVKQDVPKFLEHLRRCRKALETKTITILRLQPRHKVETPVELVSVAFRQDNSIFYRTAIIDRTDRQRTEQALQDARAYAEKIVQTVRQPLVVLDANLAVVSANLAFRRAFKIRENEMGGSAFVLLENSFDLRLRLLRAVSKFETIEDFLLEADFPRVGRRTFIINAQPFFRKADIRPLILLSMEDITKRKKVEREREALLVQVRRSHDELERHVHERTIELKKANIELQAVSVRILNAHESERKHIARELHDEIGQQLTWLQIVLANDFEGVPRHLQGALKKARGQVTELMQSIRELSFDLRPQLLDDLGLVAALQWHFKRFQDRTRIRIKFESRGYLKDLAEPLFEDVVYRVVQEALTNVARHAETRRVAVRLQVRKGRIHAEIRDFGKGFILKDSGRKKSAGLFGMRERVLLAGGEIHISTRPGSGTSVKISLPCVLSRPQQSSLRTLTDRQAKRGH